jgi:hypothetical protein
MGWKFACESLESMRRRECIDWTLSANFVFIG